MLCVVRCLLFDVCCSLSVIDCLMFVVRVLFVDCLLLFAGCWLMSVVRCSFFVVCLLLLRVR